MGERKREFIHGRRKKCEGTSKKQTDEMVLNAKENWRLAKKPFCIGGIMRRSGKRIGRYRGTTEKE